MIHLRSVTLPQDDPLPDEFPFRVPIIRTLETVTFNHEVTFLVGENGSGKSTFLEAIACATQLPTVGSERADSDSTLEQVRLLSRRLKWSWSKRTHKGFFMRSEDFFGYTKHIGQTRDFLQKELQEAQNAHKGRSLLAQSLATLAYKNELGALRASYGEEGLDSQSHGESYFKLFRARFVPNGLYLLDEPEAPLSPMRQLAFLAMIGQMVKQGAQFIIATHSPILLAYPNALILSCDDGQIRPVGYDDLEHVAVMRTFMANPQAYLHHLFDFDA